MKSLFVCLIASLALSQAVPIAVFHGMGDACIYPGMISFAYRLEQMTGAYTKCIEIGFSGTYSSLFMDFGDQGKEACRKIHEDPHFDGEF